MSTLIKRNKTYYFRCTLVIDGKRRYVTKSLKTSRQLIALQRQKMLDEEIEMGFNPFLENWDITDFLNDKKYTSISFKEAIDYFFENYTFNRPRTKKAYMEVLNFALKTFGNVKIQSLDHERCKKFIFKGEVSHSTKGFRKRHLRAFFNFLIKKGLIQTNPVKDIKIPKATPKTFRKMIKDDEFELLIETYWANLERKKKRKGYQEWQDQRWFPALMATYFFTGMRRSEAIALKGENIIGDLQGFYIDKQKGYKERIIPISKHLKPFLKDFLSDRWPLESDAFIFIDGKNDPLTGSHVLKVFNDFLEKAGIPKDRTIHGMRHASVTRWIEMGFSLSEAKDMAGHSSASVTDQMYTHLASKVFIDKMNKLEGGEE